MAFFKLFSSIFRVNCCYPKAMLIYCLNFMLLCKIARYVFILYDWFSKIQTEHEAAVANVAWNYICRRRFSCTEFAASERQRRRTEPAARFECNTLVRIRSYSFLMFYDFFSNWNIALFSDFITSAEKRCVVALCTTLHR